MKNKSSNQVEHILKKQQLKKYYIGNHPMPLRETNIKGSVVYVPTNGSLATLQPPFKRLSCSTLLSTT